MKTLITYLILPFTVSWNGFGLSVLWGWFVVPLFNLPALSLPYAIGIAMIAAYLTSRPDLSKESDDSWEYLLKVGVYSILKPIFALAFGFVVKQFIVA